MKVAIHQPQYIPWIGYFDKIDLADVFVVLDDVQYKKNEWQNRNKIRTSDDWQWLTVPVEYCFGQRISEIRIDNKKNWKKKHTGSLRMNYSKAVFFDDYFGIFEEIFSRDWEKLLELNSSLIEVIKDSIGIRTKIVTSSELAIKTTSTQRLVDICVELGARTYISGPGGKDYLREELFLEKGISLEYQEFKHPVYEQVYKGFCPHMSIVDLLFCVGEKSLDKIREGRRS